MLNQIQIIGRLGQTAELKYLQNGSAVCNFSVATEESWKDQQGKKQSKLTWFDVVLWGKFAEAMKPYLMKAVLVYVGGRMESRQFQAKDGTQRTAWSINADNLKLLGGGKWRDTGKEGHAEEGQSLQGPADEIGWTEDNIPF